MKAFRLLVYLPFFIPFITFGQSPKAIEADLVKSFKKIDYWSDRQNKLPGNAEDSLGIANDLFAKKLQHYAEKYPSTILQKFPSLLASHLDISSSCDGLFRIYSWDDQTGGTMRYFKNVFQYKSGVNTIAIVDTPGSEGDNRPSYNKVYTFKANGLTYYLCVYMNIGSSKDIWQGIHVFDIENGKLNDNVKIIKTKSGLHSQLEFGFDFFSEVDWKIRPEIYFDPLTKAINLPFVKSDGTMTHKFITYKFTGQYFEKVKN